MKRTSVALLDICKVFDLVWHDGFIYKIKQLEFPVQILKLISNYSNNRIFKVNVDGVFSDPTQIKATVPQGGALSTHYIYK